MMENKTVIEELTAEDLLEKIKDELTQAKEKYGNVEDRKGKIALWSAISDAILTISQYQTARKKIKILDKSMGLMPYDTPGNCCPLSWEGGDETGMSGL